VKKGTEHGFIQPFLFHAFYAQFLLEIRNPQAATGVMDYTEKRRD